MAESWPLEKRDRLRAMIAEGAPMKEIAYELKTTKNAVIGMANRMRIKKKKKPTVPSQVTPPAKQDARQKAKPAKPAAIKKEITMNIEHNTQAPLEHMMVAVDHAPISWLTAPESACKNVQGDPRKVMICGRPREGDHRYCPLCLVRLVQPLKKPVLEKADAR